MNLTRRLLLATTTGGLATALLAGSLAFAQDKPQIGVVVKIGGIPWFNAMEVGIKQEAEKSGADAWMVGPTQPDAAQQVRAIEDLIARGVDVIGIVPNDSAALAPVLGRAREAGIKVLAHEGPDQENMDWDFELTTTEAYGQAHMDLLAEEMGEEGEYIVYVGSLTVPLAQRLGRRGDRLPEGEVSEHDDARRPVRRRRERRRLRSRRRRTSCAPTRTSRAS